MSIRDDIHYCWEPCCDEGPHACICGQDCRPQQQTAEQVVLDALASVERGMGVEQVVAALRKAQMLNDQPWEQVFIPNTAMRSLEVIGDWETEVLHTDNGPRIISYYQSDPYGRVYSTLTPNQWRDLMVRHGHARYEYRRPLIIKDQDDPPRS